MAVVLPAFAVKETSLSTSLSPNLSEIPLMPMSPRKAERSSPAFGGDGAAKTALNGMLEAPHCAITLLMNPTRMIREIIHARQELQREKPHIVIIHETTS